MEDRTDAETIEASLADAEVFAVIFERHHDSVHRFAARRVGRDAASDVVAETFVRSFRNRHRYDTERANALPWLYGIAANVIGEHLRRARRARRATLFSARVGGDTAGDPTADADDRLVAEGIRRDLLAALAELAVADRETLLLYALEGFTYREIAATLNIPVGTVGSRMSRVRQQIRDRIPDLDERADLLGREEPGDDERDA